MFDYDYFMIVDWTLISVNMLVAVPFGIYKPRKGCRILSTTDSMLKKLFLNQKQLRLTKALNK